MVEYSLRGYGAGQGAASRFHQAKRGREKSGRICTLSCVLFALFASALSVMGWGMYIITHSSNPQISQLEEKYHIAQKLGSAKDKLLSELHSNINLDPLNLVELGHDHDKIKLLDPDSLQEGVPEHDLEKDRSTQQLLRGSNTNSNGNNNDNNNSAKKHRKRIAYAITITKDGFFQDGAAVLAFSILKHSQRAQAKQGTSGLDLSLLAFVHPLVTTARPLLKQLGFAVIEAPLPINITAIHGKFLREKINNNGCCGASELIKLNAYRLTEFDRVVHMDADTFLLNPIDELFEEEGDIDTDTDITAGKGIKGSFARDSLVYTTDPNMATHKGEDRMPVQGGFLVLKPHLEDFKAIIRTLMTTEFFQGSAWGGSKIGWFWGGMTVQGVLPYYYNKVSLSAPGESEAQEAPAGYAERNPEDGKGVLNSHFNRRRIVDRCTYNTMADTDECRGPEYTIKTIKSAHFTICQKPWTCYPKQVPINPLCGELHKEWFRVRKDAEEYYGLTVVDNACGGGRNGKNGYIAMDIEKGVHIKKDSHLLPPKPYTGPTLMEPLAPESGYIGTEWDNFVGGHVNKPRKKKPPMKDKDK